MGILSPSFLLFAVSYFLKSSLFLSAEGGGAKEAHMQCVSDSTEILMVPSVGGWYRAHIVTVQRVPSCHQALLVKPLNESTAVACTLSSRLLLGFCAEHQNHFFFFCLVVFNTNGLRTRACVWLYMDLSTRFPPLLSFQWEDKTEGLAISSFCVVLAVKKKSPLFDNKNACL